MIAFYFSFGLGFVFVEMLVFWCVLDTVIYDCRVYCGTNMCI